MPWQVLILLQTVFAALYVLALRNVARRKNADETAGIMNAIIVVVLYAAGLAALPFFGAVDLAAFARYPLHFIITGLCFAANFIFYYKVLTYVDGAIASVLGTLAVLFTAVLARFFLGEQLTAYQLLGSALLFPTIWYVLLLARQEAAREHKSKAAVKGLVFACLSGLCFAVAIVIEKSLLSVMSLSTYIVYGWGFQALMTLAVAGLFLPLPRSVLRDRTVLRSALVGGLTRALGGLLFMLALIKSDNVSIITIVSNFRIILVTLFAAWLLKEKKNLANKITAAGVAVIALTIIFWK